MKKGPKKNDDEPFLGKKAAEAPAPKRSLDEEEKKTEVVDEEAKKKARAEMRKKLMLPDNVTSKLKGISSGAPMEKKKPDIPKLSFVKKDEDSNNDVSIRDIKKLPIKEEA